MSMPVTMSMFLALSKPTMRARMRTMWGAIVGTVRLRVAEVIVLLSIGRRILRAAIMLFMMLIMLVFVTLLRYVLRLVVASMLLWRRVRSLVPTLCPVTLV